MSSSLSSIMGRASCAHSEPPRFKRYVQSLQFRPVQSKSLHCRELYPARVSLDFEA